MGSFLGTLKDWFVAVFEVVAGAVVFVILAAFAASVCWLLVLAVMRFVGWVVRPGRGRVLSRAEAEAKAREDEAELDRQYFIWRPTELVLPLKGQLSLAMRKMIAEGESSRALVMWDIKREGLLLSYELEVGFVLVGFRNERVGRFDRATKRYQAGVEAMRREYGGQDAVVLVRSGLPTRAGVRVTLGHDAEVAVSTAIKIIEGCCGGKVPKHVMIFREPIEDRGGADRGAMC